MAVQLAVAAAVGLAALLGSALVAWQSSSDNQKALDFQEKHSKEIEKMLNELNNPNFSRALTPSEIALLTQIPKLGEFIAREQPELLKPISESNPELIQHIAEKEPEVARFISGTQPELIKGLGEGAVEGRKAQKKALEALMQVGTEGDAIGQAERTRMMNQVSQQEAGQRGALTEEMARRGQLGSGRELLMKLAGQQASGQQAADMGLKSFEDAQRRRLEALSQGANLGGQMFNQDVAMERDNVSIINSFNEKQTEARRRIEEQKTADINAKQIRDAQAKRNLQDAVREDTATTNRINWQAGEDWKTDDVNARRARQAEEDARKEREADNYRDLTLSERALEDDKKQLEFENEIKKINAKQGVGSATSAGMFTRAQQGAQSGQAAVTAGTKALDTAMGIYDRYNKKDK
jgi:hypothetical protein